MERTDFCYKEQLFQQITHTTQYKMDKKCKFGKEHQDQTVEYNTTQRFSTRMKILN